MLPFPCYVLCSVLVPVSCTAEGDQGGDGSSARTGPGREKETALYLRGVKSSIQNSIFPTTRIYSKNLAYKTVRSLENIKLGGLFSLSQTLNLRGRKLLTKRKQC